MVEKGKKERERERGKKEGRKEGRKREREVGREGRRKHAVNPQVEVLILFQASPGDHGNTQTPMILLI